MRRLPLSMLLLTLTLSPSLHAEKEKKEKFNGYLEYRQGDVLIIDGQRVLPTSETEFKGKDSAKSIDTIPLGYECKAEGYRQTDGTLLATKIEAKNNGNAMFETEVVTGTNQLEAEYRRVGMMFQPDGEGGLVSMGDLYESGPEVQRARRIMRSLVPAYLNFNDMRVYVVDNPTWNAMAMGNYSFYVFKGLLQDVDDDELAIILGHELAHASHEHSRRHAKRNMWIDLAATGAAIAAGELDDESNRELVAMAANLTASAFSNGYGRGNEDQADRVGLRYAYEAGYDVTKGPRLWRRIAREEGNGDVINNFFFGSHPQPLKRAEKLEQEIANNYPDGPKQGTTQSAKPSGWSRSPSDQPKSGWSSSNREAKQKESGWTSSQSSQPTSKLSPSDSGSSSAKVQLQKGMTFQEVRSLLGAPAAQTDWGNQTRWRYPDMTLIFENGRLKDVKF